MKSAAIISSCVVATSAQMFGETGFINQLIKQADNEEVVKSLVGSDGQEMIDKAKAQIDSVKDEVKEIADNLSKVDLKDPKASFAKMQPSLQKLMAKLDIGQSHIKTAVDGIQEAMEMNQTADFATEDDKHILQNIVEAAANDDGTLFDKLLEMSNGNVAKASPLLKSDNTVNLLFKGTSMENNSELQQYYMDNKMEYVLSQVQLVTEQVNKEKITEVAENLQQSAKAAVAKLSEAAKSTGNMVDVSADVLADVSSDLVQGAKSVLKDQAHVRALEEVMAKVKDNCQTDTIKRKAAVVDVLFQSKWSQEESYYLSRFTSREAVDAVSEAAAGAENKNAELVNMLCEIDQDAKTYAVDDSKRAAISTLVSNALKA